MPRLRRTLAVLAGALTLAVVPATTAYATVPVTFTSNEPAGGASDDPDFTITTPSIGFTCATADGDGTVASSPVTTPPSGTLDSLLFTACAGPLGVPATLTPTTPWNLAVFSGGPSVWAGGISTVALHVDASPLCTVDLTGSLVTTYTLSTRTLSVVGSNLTVSNASGALCAANGDPADIAVSLHVS